MKTEVARGRPGVVEKPGTSHTGTPQAQVNITVIYAQQDNVWQVALTVPAGTSAAQALQLSGFSRAFPDYPVDEPALGIFGRRCQQDEVLSDADRLEIYRPLSFDPMESRHRRVEHRRATENKSPFRPRRVRDAS